MAVAVRRNRFAAVGEVSEIADELRDEVLQTILAVRLNLSHSVSRRDHSTIVQHAIEAQEHLAEEARRLQELVQRLEAIAARVEPDPG